MKRIVTAILAIAISFSLVGCSGLSGLTNNLGDNRMAEWKEVRYAEETTKQDFLKLKKKELESPQEQNPTIKITSQDSAGNPVVVELDLEPVISAATGHDLKSGTYGLEKLPTTPQPTGVFAETISSTTGPIKEVLHGPATLIYATGKAIGDGIAEAGGGQSTNMEADTINVTDSLNDTTTQTIGSGSSSTSVRSGDYESADEAEEEVAEETETETTTME